MLDVKQLRVLKAVSEYGSFSAAAEALSYTQPAISQQIAALEKSAGATLVDRTSRGVRLTDAGRALVDHAQVVLARLAAAEAELDAIAARLVAAGAPVRWDDRLPGVRRFYTADPFGNRLELLAGSAGATPGEDAERPQR
jgi:DNA-binding transcriptional LysR family regulator